MRESSLTEREQAVARNYNEAVFDFEADRLLVHQPVEFAITARHLARYVPDRALVADIGVGVGHYAELLARRGCSLHLADISERLLDAAATRLRAAGVADRIVDVVRTSATRLGHIGPATCDAVLLLGPLNHLPDLADREQAVQEATRILKPGGVLFAAAINRLAYLRDAFRQSGSQGAERRRFHAQFWQDGNLDPEHCPPLGYAHLSTSEDFRSLFAPAFDVVVCAGMESFTSVWGGTLRDLSAADADARLDLVERTGTTLEGLGMSDHFLYVGRKTG